MSIDADGKRGVGGNVVLSVAEATGLGEHALQRLGFSAAVCTEVLWRGDILMGSGTPNHVNDPIISRMLVQSLGRSRNNVFWELFELE